ncbi:MAG: FecCD family ABC transporter permease [Dehalococcoidia bacterium]
MARAPVVPSPPLRVIRVGNGISFRLNLRTLAISGVAVVLLVALGASALTLGSYPLSVTDVIRAVAGSSSEDEEFIVRTLRLPRLLSAVLIGAALAMSGAIFQGLVRNPLVSPDIIGIDEGATVAAVFWIVTGRDARLLPLAAFAGAVAAAALIYVLSWRGGVRANRLVLVGIGVSAVLSSIVTFLLVRFPIDVVAAAVAWSAGSVYASDWGDVQLLATTNLALGPLAAVLMWRLRVLQLGDETASTLGMAVEPTRLVLLGVGCAFAAICVSVAGPIGFVALMVPHVARMLAGPMTGGVLVVTALLGAMLLLGSDMIAQHALPVALPVGVITAVVGAPYFLFLLYRTNARL